MVTKKAKKEIVEKKERPKIFYTVGKRKRAIARAVFRHGQGRITINTIPIELIGNEIVRLRIQEPLLIAQPEKLKEWDIAVDVRGGGQMGQADAARLAIAKGVVELLPETRQAFLAYDRSLLIADPRRTEPHKPPHSSWGPRRYKQRSKR